MGFNFLQVYAISNQGQQLWYWSYEGNWKDINELVQERRNSIALAMGLRLSCITHRYQLLCSSELKSPL